jgi:hypothetical protein
MDGDTKDLRLSRTDNVNKNTQFLYDFKQYQGEYQENLRKKETIIK